MAQKTCNQFVPVSNTNTSSATICAYCGLQKFAHNNDVRNMAQTSLDFFIEKMVDLMIGLTFYENQRQDLQDAYKVAKAMHKVDCISFAEEWEIRCNEKDMDSKEQLYDEIYNKQ